MTKFEVHFIAPDVLPTYTMTKSRHNATQKDDDYIMTSLATLIDHLYQGDIVDTADLARVSETNPRSVSRWRSQQSVPRRESEERLLELRAVVDLARTVMRDDAARFWMRSPNQDLAYEKPLDLVATGRYQRVIDLLLALAEGVTA